MRPSTFLRIAIVGLAGCGSSAPSPVSDGQTDGTAGAAGTNDVTSSGAGGGAGASIASGGNGGDVVAGAAGDVAGSGGGAGIAPGPDASDGAAGVDGGPPEAANGSVDAKADGGCRRPYQPTAVWNTPDGSLLTVVSGGDKWVMKWVDSSWLAPDRLASESIWSNAPLVDAKHPYDGAGLTSAGSTPNGAYLTVSSGGNYWTLQWAGLVWTAGHYADGTVLASAPLVDGKHPYDGVGPTGQWNTPDGTLYSVVSGSNYWVMRWSDNTWTGSGHLADQAFYASAPTIDGKRPDQGVGITAVWTTPDKSFLHIVSGGNHWTIKQPESTWTAVGHLADDPVWQKAPPLCD